jgi:hypothetical protein
VVAMAEKLFGRSSFRSLLRHLSPNVAHCDEGTPSLIEAVRMSLLQLRLICISFFRLKLN